MTGQGTTVWENHAPRYIGNAAIEFGIYKISDSAKAKANRNSDYIQIRPFPEVESVIPAEKNPSYNDPNASSVKCHSSFPCGKDFQGMMEVIGGLVK